MKGREFMRKHWNPEYDKKIKNQIKMSMEDAFPSDYVKNKIDLKIQKLEKNPGGYRMKNLKKVKLVTAATVCLAFLGVGAYAAGSFKGSIGSVDKRQAYTEYTDLSKVKKEAGFEAKLPETLPSGFNFDSFLVGDTADLDDEGNQLNKRKNIMVTYKNEQDTTLTLFADKKAYSTLADENHMETREIRGNTFYYTELENLCVSDESQVTAEEFERSEKDPFFNLVHVGEGMEREESISRHLSFEKDGITYQIMTDDSIDSETLFQMGQAFFQ